MRENPFMVSITILSVDDGLSSKLEPGAPKSSRRFKAIESLIEANIATTVRIDPIIPFLNDNLEELMHNVAELGILHVTCSTYKVKPDNWKRFSHAFPGIAEKLEPLYYKSGKRIGGSTYLSKTLRFGLMKKAQELAQKNNLKFSCCREGFQFNSVVCDGSWVLDSKIQ